MYLWGSLMDMLRGGTAKQSCDPKRIFHTTPLLSQQDRTRHYCMGSQEDILLEECQYSLSTLWDWPPLKWYLSPLTSSRTPSCSSLAPMYRSPWPSNKLQPWEGKLCFQLISRWTKDATLANFESNDNNPFPTTQALSTDPRVASSEKAMGGQKKERPVE